MKTHVFQSKIYEIRGVKVMLDFDLATLYEVETKVLNQAVKRNIIRFPEDFMFQISIEEWNRNSSQFVTSSSKHRGNAYLPYAFTEQGIAMLSSVLRSEKAALINIAIMRTFVEIRKTIALESSLSQQIMELKSNLEERLSEHDVQLMEIYTVMEQFVDEKQERINWENRKRLGYK
jgi:phage regulator Rha-like protein